MNTCPSDRDTKLGLCIALLAAAAAPQAVAATSALQPAAPSTFQQAQPAFGEKVEPVDPAGTAPKKAEPFGLKPAPGLGIKPAPALAPPGAVVNPLSGAKPNTARVGKRLFDMDDRAIIIVGGKQSTVGEMKKTLLAEIARKAGPPKTVKGSARKLDLAALNVTSRTATAAPLAQRNMTAQASSRASKLALAPQAPATLSTYSQSAKPAGLDSSTKVTAVANANTSEVLKDLICADKGPPRIIEVVGRLKPGGKFSVWGRCFGARAGRVEIIGQFPDGKLSVPFTAWDMTSVDLEMPANIRGASDHAVAVTIVTADGKTTPAMQAQFIAARERVDVPDRLWSPSAAFELAATVETLNTDTGVSRTNQAEAGQVAKSLRVNPQCALDAVDTTVLSGGVNQIRGWELGIPNEAAITIDWVGTCVRTTTTTHYNYVIAQVGDDISVSSACRVAFQARAWAYCPVGVAP